MLTHMKIRNFKRFDDAEIELGKTVVLIGPNNSGKTTALQALALWDIGLRKWKEKSKKRQGKSSPEKRPGVTINRNDLISIPIPYANLLWRDLHTRQGSKGKRTKNIRIEITVEAIANQKKWECGLEFDYANDESFYCRPLRVSDGDKHPQRMPVPEDAENIHVAFLPPMSGLAAMEPKWEPGRISVLIGEGQTAQVLRNLCYQIYASAQSDWEELCRYIEIFFGVILQPPQYIQDRGEITMSYKENSVVLDISSSGRGLQQSLLLLAHLYANPKTILLLDEPDAHLEILRQRQTYQLITEIAKEKNSQIIAASHSEVVLNEAASQDIVVAFVGKPHRIDDRGSQLMKALKDIGFEQYYQAEQNGWILYLEGASDLSILQSFAKTLKHPASSVLDRPFVHYISANLPSKAREHFFGLREAKKDLVGIAIFDRLDKKLETDSPLMELMWERRELENYLCSEEVLLAYARYDLPDDLFGREESHRRVQIMRESIEEVSKALETLGKPGPWSQDIKVSDEFLEPLFATYFKKLGLPNILHKTSYHILAALVSKDKIAPEVNKKLDAIVDIAQMAKK